MKLKAKQTQKQVQDLTQTIDEAYALDLEIKQKKKLLDQKKAELKEFAMNTDQKEIQGEYGKIEFTDEMKSSINPEDLFTLMQDLGEMQNFFKLVKVNLTDTRKKLGETLLEDITDSKYVEFAKMKFKKA